jgi:hypothetical protein
MRSFILRSRCGEARNANQINFVAAFVGWKMAACFDDLAGRRVELSSASVV